MRGLFTAADFTRIDVTAVTPAVGVVKIRECFLRRHIGGIHAIANQVVGSNVEALA